MLTFAGVLFSPWIALGAMLRQSQAFARTQALEFRLERSNSSGAPWTRACGCCRRRSSRTSCSTRWLTCRRWSTPVRRAPCRCWRSLIAYLRAAVPRLHDPVTTIGQELELVRAYLELMHLRMPDRLV